MKVKIALDQARAAMRSEGSSISLRAAWRRYRNDEEGSMIIFGLFVFFIMLFLSGIALDIIRFESERAMMQNTLDRAILAAADIENTLPAKDVVDSYFTTAGLDASKVTTTPSMDDGFKQVKATTSVQMDTWFMHLFDINQLEAPAAGTAREGYGHVEISLVLDVSGSMGNSVGSSTRIELLHGAATKFLNKIYATNEAAGATKSLVTVSMIPYAQQVNLGPTVASYFNLSNEHNESQCVDFYTADYDSIAISDTTPLSRTSLANARNSSSLPRECTTDSWRTVMPFSAKKANMIAAVNALGASGDTAVDIGAKWGAALLDPAAQPIVAEIIANHKATVAAYNATIPAPVTPMVEDPDIVAMEGRPYAYNSGKSMKVLVLMTDGQNTNTYALKPEYKGGPSPLFKMKDGRDYFYLASKGTKPYYRSGSWYRESDISGSGTKKQYTYQEVWSNYKPSTYGSSYYNGATGGDFVSTGVIRTRGGTKSYAPIYESDYGEKDNQLVAICDMAKDKTRNILVYSIAFDAPPMGQAVLKDCASEASMYKFVTTGAELDDAFDKIAGQISELRLTQ